MKTLLATVFTLLSFTGNAAIVTGTAEFKYTPYISSTGDLFVSGDLAKAMFEQLKVEVTDGGDFVAKYGSGVACFKFASNERLCRIDVNFLK